MRIPKIILILLSFTASLCSAQEKNIAKQYLLTGLINKKIPVQLQIAVQHNIVIGNITYLNTKAKKPIKIIGRVDEKNQYSIHEFEKNGNISGSIYATLKGNQLRGDWWATKSDTSYAASLTIKDIQNSKAETFTPADRNQVAGEYFYQYGEKGYQGNITIRKVTGNSFSYEVGSVTHDPGRNIADASGTAVLKNNQFIIEVNKSCKFVVRFYDGFLIISEENSTQLNDCQFGFNATLAGIYLKTK